MPTGDYTVILIYFRAAELAIKTYIHLYDKPYEAINGHGDSEKGMNKKHS